MVEGTGLENRRALTRTVGSNPTLSATRIVTAPRWVQFYYPSSRAYSGHVST